MTLSMRTSTGFHYVSEKPGYAQAYLQPEILRRLGAKKSRVLDIGCGNGAMAAGLSQQGHEVWGCDWDQAGVDLANRRQTGRFVQWDLNRPVEEFPFSGFEAVISTEVIEHLFYPRKLFQLARTNRGGVSRYKTHQYQFVGVNTGRNGNADLGRTGSFA